MCDGCRNSTSIFVPCVRKLSESDLGFESRATYKAVRQWLYSGDLISFAEYINHAEDIQAVEALLHILSSPLVPPGTGKLTGSAPPMAVRAMAALYLLESIFTCVRLAEWWITTPESRTPESYTLTPFEVRCYQKLVENWSHVLKWVEFLLRGANFTNGPGSIVMDCAKTMGSFLKDSDEHVYRQELLVLPRTCDILLQLYSAHCVCGCYFYVPSEVGCSIMDMLANSLIECDGAREALVSRLSVSREVKSKFVTALLTRPGLISREVDDTGRESIRTLHALLVIIRELSKDPGLSLSFSRRHCAPEFARALCTLSENQGVEIRIGDYGETSSFWTAFASSLVVLVSIIREAQSPALDLARALEAGLFRAVLKCWSRLNSRQRRVLDEVLLFVADFLPVSCVARVLTTKPCDDLLDDAILRSDQQDMEIWKDLMLAISQNTFASEAKAESAFMMCSNLMHDQSSHPDPSLPLRTCGNCHAVTYCSKECQKEDWDKFHSKECVLVATSRSNHRKAGLTMCESARRSHVAFLEGVVNVLPQHSETNKATTGTVTIVDARATFRRGLIRMNYPLDSYQDTIGRHVNGGWDSRVRFLIDQATARPNEVRLVEAAFRNGGHDPIFVLCKVISDTTRGTYKIANAIFRCGPGSVLKEFWTSDMLAGAAGLDFYDPQSRRRLISASL